MNRTDNNAVRNLSLKSLLAGFIAVAALSGCATTGSWDAGEASSDAAVEDFYRGS